MSLHDSKAGDSKMQAMLDEQKEHKILKDYATDLYMLADAKGMSEWEKDFLFDMTNRRSFSAKQREKILQLVERHDL